MALNRADIFFKDIRNLTRYLRYGNHVPKHGYSLRSANKGPETVENKDDPIKYSKTEAWKMTREEIFNPADKVAVLPIERYIIVFTLLCFFTYFIILRKENRLDAILKGDFSKSDEEVKLLNALLHAKISGLKTDDIEKELERVRAKK